MDPFEFYRPSWGKKASDEGREETSVKSDSGVACTTRTLPIFQIIWLKMAAVLFMLAPTFGEFTRLFLDRVLGNVSIIEAQFSARVRLRMSTCVWVC